METLELSSNQIESENFPEVKTVMEWLFLANVLTEALRKVYSRVDVHVLHQHMARFTGYEQKTANLKQGYVREVLLLGDNLPCVYARVAVPTETYEKNKDTFKHLGNKPIGETLLYNREGMKRSGFQYSRSTVADLPFYKVRKNEVDSEQSKLLEKSLWTRSSSFHLNGSLFVLVSETILPTIGQFPNANYQYI